MVRPVALTEGVGRLMRLPSTGMRMLNLWEWRREPDTMLSLEVSIGSCPRNTSSFADVDALVLYLLYFIVNRYSHSLSSLVRRVSYSLEIDHRLRTAPSRPFVCRSQHFYYSHPLAQSSQPIALRVISIRGLPPPALSLALMSIVNWSGDISCVVLDNLPWPPLIAFY